MLSLAVSTSSGPPHSNRVSPPASPNLSPSRPRPAVSIIHDDPSPDGLQPQQTQQFLRRVCRCNSSDAAIFLTQLKDDVSRPRNFSSAGDFFAQPWQSPVKSKDKGGKGSPVIYTDTEGSVTAPSSTAIPVSCTTACIPHNESQASLVAMATADHDHQHVCCDGTVSARFDGDEEFLQEFVFGTSAFQVGCDF